MNCARDAASKHQFEGFAPGASDARHRVLHHDYHPSKVNRRLATSITAASAAALVLGPSCLHRDLDRLQVTAGQRIQASLPPGSLRLYQAH